MFEVAVFKTPTELHDQVVTRMRHAELHQQLCVTDLVGEAGLVIFLSA